MIILLIVIFLLGIPTVLHSGVVRVGALVDGSGSGSGGGVACVGTISYDTASAALDINNGGFTHSLAMDSTNLKLYEANDGAGTVPTLNKFNVSAGITLTATIDSSNPVIVAGNVDLVHSIIIDVTNNKGYIGGTNLAGSPAQHVTGTFTLLPYAYDANSVQVSNSNNGRVTGIAVGGGTSWYVVPTSTSNVSDNHGIRTMTRNTVTQTATATNTGTGVAAIGSVGAVNDSINSRIYVLGYVTTITDTCRVFAYNYSGVLQTSVDLTNPIGGLCNSIAYDSTNGLVFASWGKTGGGDYRVYKMNALGLTGLSETITSGPAVVLAAQSNTLMCDCGKLFEIQTQTVGGTMAGIIKRYNESTMVSEQTFNMPASVFTAQGPSGFVMDTTLHKLYMYMDDGTNAPTIRRFLY
jgi:hypothetical protein